MGSVKDLTVIKSAYENQPGIGNFTFSDRYSVFDWGAMPDMIEGKGRALATMAAFNFELLEKEGIRTHYRGLLNPESTNFAELLKFDELKEGENGSNIMQVDIAVVYRPVARKYVKKDETIGVHYDYQFFDYMLGRPALNNYLVPLEIIFRNALPEGSSVFRKIADAKEEKDTQAREQALQKIYESLGIESEPKPGDTLPEPVIGYTTKLEAGDRKLSNFEASQISGLRDFKGVETLALKVDQLITKQAEKTGFVHYDGKVEMLWNNGLVIADVLGTLDENRFGFNGEQVSKQFLRKIYQTTQPEFEEACVKWKKTGPGWQKKCPVKPKPLDPKVINLTSEMYKAATNQYTGRKIFADVPPLEEVMNDLRPFR